MYYLLCCDNKDTELYVCCDWFMDRNSLCHRPGGQRAHEGALSSEERQNRAGV